MKVLKLLLLSLLLVSLLIVFSACGNEPAPSPSEHTTHTPGKWVVDTEPDIGVTGSKHQVCSECGETIATETIPAYSEGLAYEVNEDGVTCTITGIGTCTDTELYFPSKIDGYTVTTIGQEAFVYCLNLTSITIPDSVITIDVGAFDGCLNLKSVYIGKSVTYLLVENEVGAFSYCLSLASIMVDKENPFLHSAGNCVIETKTKTLIAGCKNSVIPDDGSVTSIGEYAFCGCTMLTNINIPNSVTSIGEGSFSYCEELTSITIPDSVITIGLEAFFECHSLTSVTIGNGVTTIDVAAFARTNLTSITIPNSVTSISDSAFYDCDNLTSITVDEGNSAYHSTGNCLIETETKTLMISGCNNSVIPDDGSVTSIGDYAFASCDLTNITIPDSVTSIGDFAFSGCDFTSITIPNSVTSIGEHAFANCDLTSITIPDSVTSIGFRAFSGCDNLTSITIPDSVTYLGEEVFSCCWYLRSIHYEGTIAEWIAIYNAGEYNESSSDVYCSDGVIQCSV